MYKVWTGTECLYGVDAHQGSRLGIQGNLLYSCGASTCSQAKLARLHSAGCCDLNRAVLAARDEAPEVEVKGHGSDAGAAMCSGPSHAKCT